MTTMRAPDTFRRMRGTGMRLVARALPVLLGAGAACGGDDGAGDGQEWEMVAQDLPGALLSVWGTAPDDIWAVGSDPDGEGPTVMHEDGSGWQTLDTGTTGDLWWVFGFDGGDVYMGGAGGTILVHRNGEFTAMETPRTDVTVFGIWGCAPGVLWAVGGALGGASGAFAWRLAPGAGGAPGRWVEAEGFPTDLVEEDAIWKVYGRSCDDVWLVGTDGLVVHWDGQEFAPDQAGGESLFTVHASADRFAAVGGFGTGTLIENDGGGWVDATPEDVPPLVGVCLTEDGGVAVGQFGAVVERDRGGRWAPVETGLQIDLTMHSVWIDPDGGVWSVGGQVLTAPFVDGLMLHRAGDATARETARETTTVVRGGER
jgi:hypothetical protein